MKNILKNKNNAHKDAATPKPEKQKKRIKKQRKQKAGFLGNVRIAPKLLAAFLIIALMGTAMSLYGVLNLQNVSASAKSMHVNVLLPTQNVTSAIETFDNERISIRQALINEKELYTAVYVSIIKNSYRSMTSQFTLIESLITKESKEDFNQLKADYETYQAYMDEAIVKLEAGDKDYVRAQLVDGELKEAEEKVKASLDDLVFAITGSASTTSMQNTKTAESVFLITCILAGVVLLFSVTIGILMARGISRPIKRLTANAKLLAAGEIDVDISDVSTKDEIGQIRDAFKKMISVIKELTQDTDMLITAAAQGELSVRADAQKHEGAFRKIVEGINALLDSTVTPMVESAKALGELASGNLSVSVEGEFEGDFAIVKNAFNGTVETLKGYIEEITAAMEKVSTGILDARIDSEYKGDFTALKESINNSIASFNAVLRDIDTAAEEVALGTAQLSSGSQTISQGATEQASALEQLTSSLSEIAGETSRNSDRAEQANEISRKAKDYALTGNEKMKTLQAAMQAIDESSANISKIIKVIDDIAFQTNILSLNAAVEAARAGVHGKGFAVVADEVRNLAARSANAAKETTELIENSIKKTSAGTKIADETAKALLEIVSEVEKTVELSGEIATASNGQAVGIDQVGKGIEQLSAVVQTNSATAQEAAASAEELSSQAEYLKNMVRRFKLQGSYDEEPAQEPGSAYEPEKTPAKRGARVSLNDADFGKY